MKDPRKLYECELKNDALKAKEAMELLLDAAGRGVYFMAKAIEEHVDCHRKYDDDHPNCIDCKHYALCDALGPFLWMVDNWDLRETKIDGGIDQHSTI